MSIAYGEVIEWLTDDVFDGLEHDCQDYMNDQQLNQYINEQTDLYFRSLVNHVKEEVSQKYKGWKQINE